MTQQQVDDFMRFLQKFCSDNVGNRMNEWIIETLLNRAYQILKAIYQADNAQGPNDARKKICVP